MPLVRISMIEGRSPQQKESAAKKITEALVEECGAHAEHIYVIFDDIGETDWTVGGVTVEERKKLRNEK